MAASVVALVDGHRCFGVGIMKPSTPKLTPAQLRTLTNVRAGRRSTYGLSGQSQFGGHQKTLLSLRCRDLLDRDNQITKLGCQALERSR